MISIDFQTESREEMIDITKEVARTLEESGISSGLCIVFVKHTTCGITINENADPDVQHDMLLFLRNLVPQYYDGFRHFEHNSDSHIKSSLMGSSVSIPFENAELVIGRWQGIYLCEFDGPKKRTVAVHIS